MAHMHMPSELLQTHESALVHRSRQGSTLTHSGCGLSMTSRTSHRASPTCWHAIDVCSLTSTFSSRFCAPKTLGTVSEGQIAAAVPAAGGVKKKKTAGRF